MQKKLLVVVDMQPGWDVSDDDDVSESIHEKVLEYKQNNDFVIALEYLFIYNDDPDSYPGDTIDSIHELIDGYEFGDFVKKDDDDGSPELEPVIGELGSIDLIEVVGVNLDSCVSSTAIGIADKFPEIRVDIVTDCCDSNNMSRGRSIICADARLDGAERGNLAMT